MRHYQADGHPSIDAGGTVRYRQEQHVPPAGIPHRIRVLAGGNVHAETGEPIGANTTVLPDVSVGEDAFVAAGAVVAPETLAMDAPAETRGLPEQLAGGNSLA